MSALKEIDAGTFFESYYPPGFNQCSRPVTHDGPAKNLVLVTPQSCCDMPKYLRKFQQLSAAGDKKMLYQSHGCQMNLAHPENLCDNHDISAVLYHPPHNPHGLHWISLDSTGFHWTSLDFTI